MKRVGLFALLVALSAAPAARGGGGDIPFSITAAGGAIADEFISVFSLLMGPEIEQITSLELVITGLSHDFPDDLQIFLTDPFAGARESIEIMANRGDGFDLMVVNLIFRDDGTAPPPDETQITSGTFRPQGLDEGRDSGFATFLGSSGGHPNDWLLIVIDDAAGNTGDFTSWTLRGTYVPEPVTLSLLALGALVTFRRKRR